MGIVVFTDSPLFQRSPVAAVPSILTFNTFLFDIRLFGLFRVYHSAPHLQPRLAALPEALGEVGADVICLQEVFRKPHRAFLAETLAGVYPHAAGVERRGLPLGTGLMMLSRHPIETARIREFRAAFLEERLAIRMGMLVSVLRLPDIGRCRVINLHLAAGGMFGHPESVKAEEVRRRQIGEVLRAAGEPGPELTIIAGDFNAGPDSSAVNYRHLLDAGYLDAFAEAKVLSGQPPAMEMTWDPANPMISGELNRSLPRQRIDHVFLRREGMAGRRLGAARIVLSERRVALAGEGPVPVSDHYGLCVDIEAGG